MNNIKEIVKLFYRCNKTLIKAMSFIWLIFLVAIFLVKLIIKDSFISSNLFMGFISSMLTLSAVFPLINQFGIFPYCISLGLGRREYIKGTVAFNMLSLIIMELIINVVFIFGKITTVIVTLPGFGSAYTRIMYFGYAAGISFIFTFIAAVNYRYGAAYGISSILLLLSPLMLFRNKIFEYIAWEKSVFEITSLVFLIIGVIFSILSWMVIKKAEVRV